MLGGFSELLLQSEDNPRCFWYHWRIPACDLNRGKSCVVFVAQRYLADDRVHFLAHNSDFDGLLHGCADNDSQKVLTHGEMLCRFCLREITRSVRKVSNGRRSSVIKE